MILIYSPAAHGHLSSRYLPVFPHSSAASAGVCLYLARDSPQKLLDSFSQLIWVAAFYPVALLHMAVLTSVMGLLGLMRLEKKLVLRTGSEAPRAVDVLLEAGDVDAKHLQALLDPAEPVDLRSTFCTFDITTSLLHLGISFTIPTAYPHSMTADCQRVFWSFRDHCTRILRFRSSGRRKWDHYPTYPSVFTSGRRLE